MVSTKSTFQKLGLKPSHRALKLRIPKDVILGPLPAGATFASKATGQFDFILSFYESVKVLKTDLPKMKTLLTSTGMSWVCWRKGNVTDLSRDVIHELVEEYGLTTVSSISMDTDWSSLKLMHPKDER